MIARLLRDGGEKRDEWGDFRLLGFARAQVVDWLGSSIRANNRTGASHSQHSTAASESNLPEHAGGNSSHQVSRYAGEGEMNIGRPERMPRYFVRHNSLLTASSVPVLWEPASSETA